MISSAHQYRELTAVLVEEATSSLAVLWDAIYTGNNAVELRMILEDFLPLLVQAYGEAVAEVAIDWFMDIRESAGAVTPYTPKLITPDAAERVNASMRAVLTPLFGENPNPDLALKEVQRVLDRFVREPGRETIAYNSSHDSACLGYRRVPRGRTTCGWCIAVASREVLYRTEDAALHTGFGQRYHTGCDCEAEPVYDYDRHLNDPSRLGFEDQYYSAVELVGGNFDDITYAISARNKGLSDEHILEYLKNPRPRN